MNFQVAITKNQGGSALIVSLSILLVLTILGVSAMRTTSLEEKMAGNARDAQLAFEAAEAGLREAERFIMTAPPNTPDLYDQNGGPGGLFNSSNITADAWTVEDNWINSSVQVPYSSLAARLPRYIIQKLEAQAEKGKSADAGNAASYNKPPSTVNYYLITARGSGVSPNSRAMLQSYFSW